LSFRVCHNKEEDKILTTGYQRNIMMFSEYILLLLCFNLSVIGVQSTIQFKSTVLPNNKANFACSDTEGTLRSKNATFVQYTNDRIYVGYTQVSSDNQNPIIVRYRDGKQVWCRNSYEVTGDDGFAYGLLWDRARHILYVVFTATGTQGQPEEDYRRFTKNGWLTSYGSGGGAKVAIISRVNTKNGNPMFGTFVTAINSGKSNSIEITKLSLNSKTKHISIEANCWWLPRKVDRTPMNCTGSSPFQYRVSFTTNLSIATSASAETCF
jgi:hypothetical protein